MKQVKPISVDFSQETATAQMIPRRNLLSSRQAGWQGIYLEYHNSPSHETPEHYPTQHVVAIQTQGVVEAERKLGDRLQQEQIRAGDVCIVPAYTRHQIRSQGEQGLILLSLEPSLIAQVAPEFIDRDRIELLPHFAQADPLVHQIGLSLKSALENNGDCSRFYADALGVALVAHLLQFYTTQKYNIQERTIPLADARIQQAKDYIHAHLSDDLSLDAIATSIGMSQYHFCRVFKQAIGLTPWQYAIKRRIEAAKGLLKMPQLSIGQISYQLGYSTQAQFTNFFRKHVGVSPSTYRQQ